MLRRWSSDIGLIGPAINFFDWHFKQLVKGLGKKTSWACSLAKIQHVLFFLLTIILCPDLGVNCMFSLSPSTSC